MTMNKTDRTHRFYALSRVVLGSVLAPMLGPLLGCGLFPTGETPPPATTAAIVPAVSFPTVLDCSAGGADPISVSWDVKPFSLTSSAVGVATEFSAQEILANTSGSPSVCYYTPASQPSVATAGGLRPGMWQITLTHYITGYPSPIVCTRQLVAGNNQILFTVERQTPTCDVTP